MGRTLCHRSLLSVTWASRVSESSASLHSPVDSHQRGRASLDCSRGLVTLDVVTLVAPYPFLRIGAGPCKKRLLAEGEADERAANDETPNWSQTLPVIEIGPAD